MKKILATKTIRIAAKLSNGKLLDLPDLRQMNSDTCGASAAQAVLAYYGYDFHEESLWKNLMESKAGGVSEKKLVALFDNVGLHTVARNNMTIDNLKTCIDKGYPVIILFKAWGTADVYKNWKDSDWGHYAVVIGYSDGKILFEDPATFELAYMREDELEKKWVQKDSEGNFDHFGIVVVGTPEYNPLHMHRIT